MQHAENAWEASARPRGERAQASQHPRSRQHAQDTPAHVMRQLNVYGLLRAELHPSRHLQDEKAVVVQIDALALQHVSDLCEVAAAVVDVVVRFVVALGRPSRL